MRLRDFSTAALAACALFALACSDDDGGTVEPPLDPPIVTTISSSSLSPGDTLTINGSNFASPPAANQVKFTNPLGVSNAFAGSETQLEVVVDQDATSGPITVTTEGGSDTGPDVTINRGIGDFFVFGGLGPSNILTLPNPTATTRYLVIPHGTNASAPYIEDYGYGITTGAPLASAPAAAGPTRQAAAQLTTIRESFDAMRWEQAQELAERIGVPEKTRPQESTAEAAAPPFRQFYVLNTTTGSALDPSSFDRITAERRYAGTKCEVYADVDTLANPANNFDPIHFQQLGQEFDNSIEATNVSYFGGYSDVDGNGKVIILITPVVNRLTPGGSGGFIAGFFLAVDLYAEGQVPAGTTNHAEIFYLLAADPQAQWGNPFPIAFTADENVSTTAHEHEHMISFSHRIFNQGGATQVTWLEEGMAHMAEALNGFHDANQGRADIYMQGPAGTSLEHATANLPQRGGIYLFLQLMVDRYGADILKDIVQSRCSGRPCVESATGRGFYDLVAEFLAALFVSGK
ncbi:MAG TPA: IPT/TIG domain-containing protein, partial [Candidatus Krumholzibacteria bacterium]|nr:IPT/TIG domain-containing protein [Candidatus Krumholzibacteria bacterium]